MYLHSLKKQSSISLTSSLLEQKTINSVFSKHYVRADILGNTSTQLLDNNNTFINFTMQELKKKSLHLDTKHINIGRSVGLDSFIFKNKRNNTVQLDSFLENRQISIENKLLDLTFWLNSMMLNPEQEVRIISVMMENIFIKSVLIVNYLEVNNFNQTYHL